MQKKGCKKGTACLYSIKKSLILSILIFSVLLSLSFVSASTDSLLQRTMPLTVNPGESFNVSYQTIEAPNSSWLVSWRDSISGGCSPVEYKSFMNSTLGGEQTKTKSFIAPVSGSCTFSGYYQYSNSLKKYFAIQTIYVTEDLSNSDGDVAYIYKEKINIDSNVINVFSSLGLDTDLIQEESIDSADLSRYLFLFVGDERFSAPIPVNDFPSIVSNSWHGTEWGIVDRDGVSSLSSNQILKMFVNGIPYNTYTQTLDSSGNPINYYFLSNIDKSPILEPIALIPALSSGGGDVVSFASDSSVLLNGKTQEGGLCFYGIVDSDYWTPKSIELLEACAEQFMEIECTEDSDCGTDGYINQEFCSEEDLFREYRTFECINAGTVQSYCDSDTEDRLAEDCG